MLDRFADRVVALAALGPERRPDLRASASLSGDRGTLRFTCSITGSSHERPWNGSHPAANAFVDSAAEDTAHLILSTPHYAWLRSRP